MSSYSYPKDHHICPWCGTSVVTSADVVPLQPTNICDNGLAALQYFGQIHGNIVQKATTFFRTILALTVQIIVTKPAKTEATSDTYSEMYGFECTVTSRPHNNNNINHQTSSSTSTKHGDNKWLRQSGLSSCFCLMDMTDRAPSIAVAVSNALCNEY